MAAEELLSSERPETNARASFAASGSSDGQESFRLC